MRGLPVLAVALLVSGCGSAEPAPVAAETVASAAPVTPRPAPAEPAAAQVDFATLAGRWKVVGVAPGSGVQALVKDDPAYMGRIVAISAERLAWAEPAGTGATVDDRCDGPVTQRLTGASARSHDTQFADRLQALGMRAGDPHGIECDSGHWGPEAAGGSILYVQGDDRLAFSWYDGVVLKLARAS